MCKTHLDYVYFGYLGKTLFFCLNFFNFKKKEKSLTENTLFLTLVCLLCFVTCILVIRLVFFRQDCVNFYFHFSGVLRVFIGLFSVFLCVRLLF